MYYNLFIYCNLVKYSQVGGTKAPILRIIPTDPTYEDQITLVFTNIYYYPLVANFFSEILVSICSSSGEVVNFDFGKTHMKLHFRRKRHAES